MEQRNVKKVDNIHVTFTNKENHQRIQTHKHRHSLQEHKHITTTHKIQNTISNIRTRQKRSLYTYMQHLPHIIYGTKKASINLRFHKHKRHIKHNEPQSAHALHIRNCKHEYGTFGDTVTLLKHIDNHHFAI